MRTPLLVPALAGVAIAAGAPAAALPPGDPFEPEVRWTWSAPATGPWIPRDVAFAAGGELVWAAPAVANPALAVLSSPAAPGAPPLFVDGGLAGAIGPVRVEAGDDAGELFAVAQYANGAARRTAVTRHDAPQAALGSTFLPTWTYDPEVATVRPALLSGTPDAAALVVAVHDGAGVMVDWVDPVLGVRTDRAQVGGLALSALSVSADGTRAALVAGLDLWVIERGGAVLHHETLAATTDALALSADGAALAVGGFSAVRVLADGPGGFAPAATVAGGAAELPTRVALDADGETLAVGWWDFATGTSVRLEVWDLVAGVRRVHRDQPGLAAAPQNFPQAVLLTRDGRRAAFGLWGAADARPEALLVDVATDTDVLAVDLPGSVEAAALDASGTRLALAVKDAHANAFASTGSVLLVDSGERDVQVVVPPAPGGVLSLAASRPGQDLTLFLLGAPAAALPVPGLGTSWVDPTQRVFWLGALPDAAGQSSRVLPLPATTDLVDLPLAVQAIFVGPGWLELSGTAARPVVL